MTIRAAADGHGATLTFSGFSMNIISIDGPSLSRAHIETTHMATANNMTYIPADLVEPGDISLEVEFDTQAVPPIAGAAGSLVIVWGGSIADTWTFSSAFMTAFKGGAKTGARMTASVTFKVSSLPVVS